MKQKSDHKRVPGKEELGIELSEEGRRRFAAMTEQKAVPGAAKKRLAKLEAELAKTQDKRVAAARGLAHTV